MPLIDTGDLIRFQERMYDHIREEMIVHIKHRRALALATIVGIAVLFGWIWSNGTGIVNNDPWLRSFPLIAALLGWAAIEATNLKIKSHNSYLRMVEERYESADKENPGRGGNPIQLFVGFEGYHKAEIEKSGLASEAGWLRRIMLIICGATAALTFFV